MKIFKNISLMKWLFFFKTVIFVMATLFAASLPKLEASWLLPTMSIACLICLFFWLFFQAKEDNQGL